MATNTWTYSAINDWIDSQYWSLGTYPGQVGATDDVVINEGFPQITDANVGTVNSVDNSSYLEITDGQLAVLASNSFAASGTFVNSNTFYFDASGGDGGSTLTVGGLFTNSGPFTIGNASLSADDLVEVGGYDNTDGTTRLIGGATHQAALIVDGPASLSPTPGVMAGSIVLTDDALVDFTLGGQITEIAGGGGLTLDGMNAFVGNAAYPADVTSNSALTGLDSIGGALHLYDGAQVDTSTALTNLGQIFVSSGAQLDIGGPLTNSGNILLDQYYVGSGSLVKLDGALTNAGTLTISPLDSVLATSDVFEATGVDNTNGFITLDGGADTANSATLQIDNGANSVALGSAAGHLDGFVNLSGASQIEFTGENPADDQITEIDFGAVLSISGDSAFIDHAGATSSNSALEGLKSVDQNSQLSLYDGAQIVTSGDLSNAGYIYLDQNSGAGGAGLDVKGVLTNSGQIQIGNASNLLTVTDTLEANSVDNAGGTINLHGNAVAQAQLTISGALTGGTVNLDFGQLSVGAAGSGGVIDFGAGVNQIDVTQGGVLGDTVGNFTSIDDSIDFQSVAYAAGDKIAFVSSGSGASGVDYIETASGVATGASFAVDDDFSTLNVVRDSHGDVSVNSRYALPCYCRGTSILTDRGEVAVEDLRIGDRVATVFGGFRPIKWIGRRAYAGRFLLGRKDMLPVCFKAGSLGDNLPARDLFVSPLHAMYLEKVLIPASALIDGVAITQAVRRDSVEYFHIELDSHDVIFAEGAPSETFLDDDSRNIFQNAWEYATLYGDEMAPPARFRAPRKEDGFEVERARRGIAARRKRAAA